MITIQLQLPEDLADEVLLLQDRLPEIIVLGSRQWRKQPTLTPRQQVEKLWEAAGMVTPLDAVAPDSGVAAPQRHSLVHTGGKSASEIIIKERAQQT